MYHRGVSIIVLSVLLLLGGVRLAQDLPTAASGLSAGTHTIPFRLQDDEGEWSGPVARTRLAGLSGSDIRVSNLRDVSASVSWITTVDADGRVYYGTDPASLINVAHDDRGGRVQDEVHHVTIGGLKPDTTYYFYIASDGATDDNGGNYYQFTTGAALNIPRVDLVWGQVFKSDGVTPAANVLVYLRVLDNDGSGSVGQSSLLSGLTDGNGYWIDPKTGGAANLAAARTEDGQSYYVYSESGDALRIGVHGGADCDGLMQVDTGGDSPAPPITLSCLKMMVFDIGLGWQGIVFPALPDPDYDAQRLLEDIAAQGGCPTGVYRVFRWVSELGNWAGYLRGRSFGSFLLRPGEPYFLGATCRSLLRLPANFIIEPGECNTLTTGWNFVIPPCSMTAQAACEQIVAQGGDVGEIDYWDASVGNWVGYVCGLPFGDFEMTPDEGYFIKSRADSVWCPASTTAP